MKKPGAKAKTTVKMAPKMPNGTEVVDISKGVWKIGDAIGSGGFGLIYLTQKCPLSGAVSSRADQVMKLEPHDSGPLFCEQAFFQRATKQENVKAFKQSHRLSSLGLPSLLALGSHTHNGEKLRFLVIPRFNVDLQKLFEKNGKKFLPGTVFRVALQVLDVLEYIHSQGYAHADIKAANLMIGNKDPNQVYLIDYGLAFKFCVDGKHKEYKEDPRKAHDGTAEYASRDAHNGVWPSARGDLEILGYCMWQWLAGRLPWEADINNKPLVAEKKNKHMGNIDANVAPLIKDAISSKGLCNYLTSVKNLDYDEEPDYDNIRQNLLNTISSLKCKLADKLDFGSSDAAIQSPVRRSTRVSTAPNKKPIQSLEDLLKSPIRKPATKPSKPNDNVPKSPARVISRERLFSMSPPPRSKVTKAVNNGDAKVKASKKVITNAPTDAATTTTNRIEGASKEVRGEGSNSRKRKMVDQDDKVSPKKTKVVAAATDRTPVSSRTRSPKDVHLPYKVKPSKGPKVCSSTQTTPGLRRRSGR